MIASAVESFIKKFCGKYLKNFGTENLKIELLKITLINIEIRAEEFNRFQLPFSPEKVTIDTIEVDLPLILGSTFKAVIRGLSINLKRVANTSYDDTDSVVQSMIQNWIAFFYFSLLSLSHGYYSIRKNLGRGAHSNSKLSSVDLENYQRLFEQLEVHFHDIHFHLQDNINSHIHPGNADHHSVVMGFGFRVVSLELRPPSTEERGLFAATLAPTVNDSKILFLKKILKCCGLRVYCRKESDLANGDILEDLSFTAAMSVCFQKITQVFGPASLSLNAENIRVHLTDEQLLAMNRVAQIFRTYFYDLRSQSRIALCHQRSPLLVEGRSRRARMRWGLIRSAVRIDWWKFADQLADSDMGGSIKWRSWFSIWRLAARYVAIRELITYHVGYESFTNSDTGATTYAAKEKLMMYYERLQKDRGSRRCQLYQGPACFSTELLTAVELIIASRYKNIDEINEQQYIDVEIDHGEVVRLNDIDPLNLPASVISVLYALQLELDSILPFKISAFCRIYADEKCELRNRMQMIGVSEGENEAGDLLNNTAGMNFVSGATLFVGVVHATNLKPSFVSSSVSSFCALESDLWIDNETVVVYTTNAVGKVNPTSGVAFTVWGEAFSLPLSGELLDETPLSTSSNAPQKAMNDLVTITCYNKGVFNISYGSRAIPTKSFLTPADKAAIVAVCANRNETQGTPYIGSIESSNATLQSTFLNAGSPNSGDTDANSNAVSVRIITCCAVGSAEHLATFSLKFKEKLKEITDEQQVMLERQSQLRLHEDDDEESQFILDPSLLTIQDFKVKISLPRFEIVASLVPCPSEADVVAVKPLTILKVLLDRILIQGTVSNNPWNISSSGLVGRISVEMLQEEGKEFDVMDIETELESIVMSNNRKIPNNKLCMLPVLSLPRIQAHVQFSQTSTLARKLDGSMDSSCFDYTASISAFPLTMSFHPQAAGGGLENSNSWASIWKAKNPLSHLFLTRMHWSKGFSSSHCAMEGHAASVKPEAESHLGRKYEPYPKHLNVVTSLWASARAWMKRGQQRYQTTSIKCSTPVRALDVEFTFPTESSAASRTVNETSSLKSIPVQAADSSPAPSGAAPPLNFFDWFGYHTPTAAAPAAKIELKPTAVPIEASYVEPEEVTEERNALLQRIEELEKRNTFLESMLKL